MLHSFVLHITNPLKIVFEWVGITASYLGGSSFKCQPRDQLSRLNVFSPSENSRTLTQTRPQPPSSASSLIHDAIIILPFDTIQSKLQITLLNTSKISKINKFLAFAVNTSLIRVYRSLCLDAETNFWLFHLGEQFLIFNMLPIRHTALG